MLSRLWAPNSYLPVQLLIAVVVTAFCYPQENGPDRKVFAHYVPWHTPDYSRPDRTADANRGIEGQIVNAASAGIDGLAIDIVQRPPVKMIDMLGEMAEIASKHAPDFAIIPCLDCAATQNVDDWQTFLLEWFQSAGELPSTYRVNGAGVVFTYAAFNLPPADWVKLRQRLAEDGQKVFLIGEMNGLYRNTKNPMPRIREYADVFDGLYFFQPNSEEHERNLAEVKRSDGHPLVNAFSVSPGYWRVNTGSFTRPFQGTRTYRASWDLACRLPVQWVSITSWNDYTENTHIEPSRNFSDSYSRLTQIGASRFRGKPIDDAVDAETFWLTAPAEMPDGPGPAATETDARRETVFEVLRVGPSESRSKSVKVVVSRPDGEVLVEQTLTFDSDKSIVDRQFSWQPDEAYAEQYLQVTAIAEKQSASIPIRLWPRNAVRRYNMAPRRARLSAINPEAPVITLANNKLAVSTIPGKPGMRTDLLHNLMPRLDPRSKTSRVADGRYQIPTGKPEWGFWEAALVMPDRQVIWAPPLYIAPDDDLNTIALYRFDDIAQPGVDQSAYARNGQLRGRLAKLTDQNNALVCGSESWFAPPGGFCPMNTPLTVELWAKPEKPGGIMWGDVGVAMQLSLTPEGKAVATRRQINNNQRVSVTSAKPLETGRWAHLAGVFNGESLKLYVNGKLVAEDQCKGPAKSLRMAVGRNPYDSQSSIFTGLIDDVRLSKLALEPEDFGPLNPGTASSPAGAVE